MSRTDEQELRWLVGARLKHLRKHFKFVRQEDLGAHLGGVPATTISRVERGGNLPGPRLCLALIEKFDLNLNWLFAGQGDMFAGSRCRRTG